MRAFAPAQNVNICVEHTFGEHNNEKDLCENNGVEEEGQRQINAKGREHVRMKDD